MANNEDKLNALANNLMNLNKMIQKTIKSIQELQHEESNTDLYNDILKEVDEEFQNKYGDKK